MSQLQPQQQIPLQPQRQPQQPSPYVPQPSQYIPQQPQVMPQQPQAVPQTPASQFSPFQTRFTANDLPIPGRCGTQANDRIVGGEETSILDYPW